MSAPSALEAARRGAAVFRLPERGLVRVRGGDRVRWLNGMVSNDVAALEAGPERSGCHAALLSPKGYLQADLHVLWREGAFWLETERENVPSLIERLDRYVIADDVRLEDASDEVERLGVEGPAAARVLRRAGLPADLRDHACLDGDGVAVARFGWTGEVAYQLFLAPGAADAWPTRLAQAARKEGVPFAEGDAAALDILRIEAGTPRWGAELDDDVFPDEAHLGDAISTTKGCYTGQEIVARIRSRGQVNHLLVGLCFEGEPPEPGAVLSADGRATGEVTSVCHSPAAGAIGLGFVRRRHAEAGREVELDGGRALVAALPFVEPAAPAEGRPAAAPVEA